MVESTSKRGEKAEGLLEKGDRVCQVDRCSFWGVRVYSSTRCAHLVGAGRRSLDCAICLTEFETRLRER